MIFFYKNAPWWTKLVLEDYVNFAADSEIQKVQLLARTVTVHASHQETCQVHAGRRSVSIKHKNIITPWTLRLPHRDSLKCVLLLLTAGVRQESGQ